MAETPIATCASNGTTIYGSHGVSSVTDHGTGNFSFNFDSTAQTYRTSTWDGCNLIQPQTPYTNTSAYRCLTRYNYHHTSNQTRVNCYTTSVYLSGYFYGYMQDPGWLTLVATSGGTQDVDECDVVGAVRFSTGTTISTWETGVSSVSSIGTGHRRVNWTTDFQNNFSSDYRAAAIQFQFYASGYNTMDLVYSRAAGFIQIRCIDSNGTARNQTNCSLLAFKTG